MARFTATVVLPTPPLPEPTATIFETPGKATGEGMACACAIDFTPFPAIHPNNFIACAGLVAAHSESRIFSRNFTGACVTAFAELESRCSFNAHHARQNRVHLPHAIRQRRRARLQNDVPTGSRTHARCAPRSSSPSPAREQICCLCSLSFRTTRPESPRDCVAPPLRDRRRDPSPCRIRATPEKSASPPAISISSSTH